MRAPRSQGVGGGWRLHRKASPPPLFPLSLPLFLWGFFCLLLFALALWCLSLKPPHDQRRDFTSSLRHRRARRAGEGAERQPAPPLPSPEHPPASLSGQDTLRTAGRCAAGSGPTSGAGPGAPGGCGGLAKFGATCPAFSPGPDPPLGSVPAPRCRARSRAGPRAGLGWVGLGCGPRRQEVRKGREGKGGGKKPAPLPISARSPPPARLCLVQALMAGKLRDLTLEGEVMSSPRGERQ